MQNRLRVLLKRYRDSCGVVNNSSVQTWEEYRLDANSKLEYFALGIKKMIKLKDNIFL
jgi:hypothetical protein